MHLDKTSFPISFTFEDCVAYIESLIKSRGWTNFEVADVKLVYYPYWFYRYDTYEESVDETVSLEDEEAEEEGDEGLATDGGSVTSTSSGYLALDAVTAEINEEIASFIESEEPKRIKEVEEGYEFGVPRHKIKQHGAEKIAPLKTAEHLGVPLDKVIISHLKLIHVPYWNINVSVAEGVYAFEINAVSGEPTSEEEIPEREKGWMEITNETLEELKQPGAWVEYAAQISGGVLGSIKKFLWRILSNRTILITILLLILLLVIFSFYGYL